MNRTVWRKPVEWEVIYLCRKEGAIGSFDRMKTYFPVARSRSEAIDKTIDYLHAAGYEPYRCQRCRLADQPT